MAENLSSNHEKADPSAEKWKIVGDLEEKTLGQKHLSLSPSDVRNFEAIGQQGLNENYQAHLREEATRHLGTSDYGKAAVVYEDDTDRGLVASHYISLEPATFGQPITDPEVRDLPVITGLAQGDQVPTLHRTTSAQETTDQVHLIEAPKEPTLLPAGEEELLLPGGGVSAPEAPLSAREQRQRDAMLGGLRNAVEAIATERITNDYREFEAAVSGTLYLSPSELSISSIDDAVVSWESAVRGEREALDSLREALSGYGEFDSDGKVTSAGRAYMQGMEAELDNIDDRLRRIRNDDMENARKSGEFSTSIIRQRMADMMDAIERIRGHQRQIVYLIEGEEEEAAQQQTVTDEAEPERDTMLARLEAKHAAANLDIDNPVSAGESAGTTVDDDTHFANQTFLKRGQGKHWVPQPGESLIERQHNRDVTDE